MPWTKTAPMNERTRFVCAGRQQDPSWSPDKILRQLAYYEGEGPGDRRIRVRRAT